MRGEKKNVGQGAIDVGGGGEIGAEPFEGGVRGAYGAKIRFLFCCVMSAERRALVAAPASVGVGKLTAMLGEISG